MSQFKVYIKPFDDEQNLTEFVDITSDVVFDGMGGLRRLLDNDRYQVGQFKYDEIAFRVRNEHGKYSDVGTSKSMFKFRRGGSEFKITWQIQDFITECGIVTSGACKINTEVDVFVGILDDKAAKMNIDEQVLMFHALGKEAIFSEVEAPFDDLSNGDLYSEALFTVLNQATIEKYLTVDADNISVGLDQAIDDISKLENKTVKEVLDKLLFQSNSVLYVDDGVVYVKDREAGATSVKTFYGQASNEGLEEIIDMTSVSSGINQTFNYWTWQDTDLVSIDVTSVNNNGIRKQEVSFDEITDTAKRQAVLDEQRVAFGSKKQELEITVPITYENLEIGILDQVRIDYPTVFREGRFGVGLPLYGVSKYGEAVYPQGEYSLTISDLVPYKVIGITVQTKDQNIKFKLKEV